MSFPSRFVLVVLGGLAIGSLLFAFARRDPVEPPVVAAAVTTRPPTTVTSTTVTSTTVTSTTTTTLAPTTSSTEPPRGSLVIHGVGDVNTDVAYLPALAANGHDHAWEALDGLFAEDDLTIINLECAPSDLGEPEPKDFVFRCDTESLPVMAAAGVDVVNLGNNHSADYGKDALVDGRAHVQEAGMVPVGAGRDAAEAHLPALVEVNGWKVAVLGFGGVYPTLDWFATADRPGMADGDTIETMVAAVEAADAVADIVVVTIHWGVEGDTEPRPEDRERAGAMVAAGADVIFGHHAHRLQPLEVLDGAQVAWGLGNFVWPAFSEEGATTAIARVEVSPEGDITSCLIPAYISSPGRPEIMGDVDC